MNKKVLSNLIWRLLERCGAQGVTLIVSVILARLLAPSDYGVISLIMVFITILEVFIDSGLGNALIQKKDADEIDFSTVFYFNLGMCSILYIGLFTMAPVIANFYSNDVLVLVIRVLGMSLLISGLKNVQQAYVSRNLIFKKFFFATIGGTVTSAVIGIVIAYLGGGVWALVFQGLSNQLIDTMILWIIVKWRPVKVFSWRRFKKLFSYAWKLLVSSFIDTIYQKLRQLLIGKIYSTADLAYYNQGQQIPYAVVSNINASIDSVLLPAIASVQDSKENVKKMTRRAIKTSSYIMTPFMIGIFVIAEKLVELLLTEKWLPCVFFLQISCISFIFTPINTANINAIKAIGRSEIILKIEILKKVVGCVIILFTIFGGIKAIAMGLLLSNVVGQIINAWPNKKILDYGYFEQLKDIIPNILLALCMGMIINVVTVLKLSALSTIVVQIIFGMVIYVALSIVTRNESFFYLWNMIFQYTKSR
ncbi:MAG: lipopolysaccharide biosynthesis protein [Ruminococcus sp.]|nr:lipopolysaccharide biosynthesis protein [Ruminococcus sp.]